MLRKILKKIPFAVCFMQAIRRLNAYWSYRADFKEFYRLSRSRSGMPVDWRDRYPCLNDKTISFDSHYIFHTAWAARILSELKPALHVDISSCLYFISIISAFIRVDFYDYRPVDLNLDNLSSGKGDLLSLPFADRSISSLSCMHVIEHVGLGRYGDPMDADGDIKAMKELKRVLAIGGTLLFVVPVGQPKVMFNAHRIYSYEQIVDYFSDLHLVEFSLIPEDSKTGGLIRNASPDLVKSQTYACGCFRFEKKRNG